MRLIDADALKYEPLPKGDRNYRTYNLDDAYEDGYDDAFVDVRNAPTIDAKPIRHGKWIRVSPAKIYECSECGQNVCTGDIECYRFCHQCGARMDEDE